MATLLENWCQRLKAPKSQNLRSASASLAPQRLLFSMALRVDTVIKVRKIKAKALNLEWNRDKIASLVYAKEVLFFCIAFCGTHYDFTPLLRFRIVFIFARHNALLQIARVPKLQKSLAEVL